jgi:hypothetical protein
LDPINPINLILIVSELLLVYNKQLFLDLPGEFNILFLPAKLVIKVIFFEQISKHFFFFLQLLNNGIFIIISQFLMLLFTNIYLHVLYFLRFNIEWPQLLVNDIQANTNIRVIDDLHFPIVTTCNFI